MDVTRRQFLGGAASAMTMLLPRAASRAARWSLLSAAATPTSTPDAAPACALLDLGDHCALRESLAGYASALNTLGARWTRADARSISSCALLVVPGALAIPPVVADRIADAAREGATVIIESGAVFSPAASDALAAHRAALRDAFGIHLGTPVSLWPRPTTAQGLPYVEYTWPSAVRVRDFSRVMPIDWLPHGDIIARVDDLPVALERKFGHGTLIFLGSPLGPALRAGDPDATSWLRAVE